MAAEFAVINPRRRRRRSRRRATTTRRRRRRTTKARFSAAPRRRRRRGGRRPRRLHRTRRARRNPGLGGLGKLGFMGVDFGAAALIGAGVVGSEIGAGMVSNFLPADWRTGASAPFVKLGTKAAVGIGVPWVLRGMIGRRVSNLLMTGTAVGLVLDAYHAWIAPMIGLTGYEQGSLGAYETGQLGWGGGDEANVSLGGSVYEGGTYD